MKNHPIATMAQLTARNKAIFDPLEQSIRGESYSNADLLNVIARFIQEEPRIAYAMAMHSQEVMREFATPGISYTAVVVLMYYRTFFDPMSAPKYGTDMMVNDPVRLEQFVAFLSNPSSASGAMADLLPRSVH